MFHTTLLPRQALTLERLLGYHTERGDPATEPARVLDRFTIALSREVGTPALEVAQQVAGRLGWQVFDRELPVRIAGELGLPIAVVEEIDERGQSWLLECIESFISAPERSESRYFRRLIAVLRSLGEQGRGVIVGRGAAYVLPPNSTLRVRLVGDREDRIAAFGRRLHLDRKTAARQVEEINRQRNQFIREHFHIDPAKPRNYDLVLNTSQWSPADCADVIVQALHHKATAHLSG